MHSKRVLTVATFWSKLESEEREKHSAAQKNRVILEGLCEIRRVKGKNHDEMGNRKGRIVYRLITLAIAEVIVVDLRFSRQAELPQSVRKPWRCAILSH